MTMTPEEFERGFRRDFTAGEGPRREAVTPVGRTVSAGWMITFADLLALLVSFFVLLFATTTVEPNAWRRVVQSAHPFVAGTVLHPQDQAPAPNPSTAPGHDLNYLEVLLRQLQDTHPSLSGLGIDRRDHALVLHMPDALLRPPASQNDDAQARADLMRLLAALDNQLEVVVHGSADAMGAGTAKDASAPWSRMLEGAAQTVHMLADAGITRAVSTTAMLDLPSGANRIDLVIHELRGVAVPASGGGNHGQ